MTARVDEIAPGVVRISVHRPDGLPGGLVYNQFVILAERPMLVHTGMRTIFPTVLAGVAEVVDPASLGWITGAHASRPDEFGAVNEWLAVAPGAQVVHGTVAVQVCLRHVTDRTPVAVTDRATVDLGERQVRFIATPHVPFWEAGLWIDEATRTLFCGDLFTMAGDPPAVTDADIVGPTLDFEARMRHFTVSAHVAPTLRILAELGPRVLAPMHGPAYTGDGPAALTAMVEHYEAAASAGMTSMVPDSRPAGPR
ncbi:MAG: MBL fold metallo-hydrolase [Kineosporiaceae bacterium]